MAWRLLVAALFSSLLAASGCGSDPGSSLEGTWRAVLTTPGGELPFLLVIDAQGAVIRNGAEVVPFSSVERDGSRVVLRMEGYDSAIHATWEGPGAPMTGEWIRTRPEGEQDRLPFRATPGETRRFLPAEHKAVPDAPASVAGAWAVVFSDEDGQEPARGEFTQEGRMVTGTFLTPTGDYRFLAGDYQGGVLRLSCFDGAHAFLFRARADGETTLSGDFWSRGTYHATWTARRIEPDAEEDGLPDPFEMVGLTNDEGRLQFTFPDLDGEPVSLSDRRFAGEVVLVSLFGTWCPNCNDEAPILARWHRDYRERGLQIIGLAYEFTGDVERDRRMVRLYAKRYGLEFPLLLAGISDKAAASATLPDLTAVLAYPTTVFVGRDGRVRNIHSGFEGPATGEHHEQLVARMEAIIEELLAEPAPPVGSP